MMLRGGMRYFGAWRGAAQHGVGHGLRVHYYHIARSLSSMFPTSSSSSSVAMSWSCYRPAPVAVPCRLSGFSSLFPTSRGSNCGLVRLLSIGRTSQDAKETKPVMGHAPTSLTPKKTEEDVGQELKQQPSEELQHQSWRQRAKTFAIEYGRVGICTHLVLSLVSFSVIYVGVSSGLDVKAILDSIGISMSASTTSAGSVLIAYTLYKLLAPVRWALTFAVTPLVLRALRRRGYMLATTNSPSSPPQ